LKTTIRCVALTSAWLLLSSPGAIAAGAPKQAVAITETGYRSSIATLASDAFEGRKPGQPGEQKTLAWLEAEFKRIGLKPGPGGYRQEVPLVEITAMPTAELRVAGPGGVATFAYADDMVVWSRRVQPAVSVADSPLVFVGHGINAPEFAWNDYAGIDMHGKTAVILVNDPGYRDASLFKGRKMTYYGRWTYKYEEAMRQGADAALIVHQTGPAAYGWDVVRNGNTGPLLEPDAADGHAGRVAIEGWMTIETTRRIFSLAGQDFDELEKAATRPGFHAVPLGLSASVAVRNAVRRAASANVIGVLPGSRHPDEYVVYMAHWDHFGRSLALGPQQDGIYNGAVDNATGVAGILEIAKAFRAGKRPDRTIVFLAVTAEEQGLLGSAYYGQHPLFPLASTAAAINIDALSPVGRTRDVEVLGFGASQLEDYLKDAAAKTGRVLRPDSQPEKGYFFRSDHFNLSKVGVPSLYIKPGIDSLEHPAGWIEQWQRDYVANRYHKPSDEYDAAWDVSGSVEDLRLLYEVGHRVASERLWPEWYPDSEFRAAREASRKAGAH
jgi:Zn-dependent M28 family amino/carboxypeptidase